MTTIAQHFEQAQLSLAAYALDLQQGMSGTAQGDIYRLALEAAGMTPTQAAAFASTYTVVDQSGGLGSLTGFSATLFQNAQTGQKYLSIRGTELGMGLDLWADATIAFGNPLLNLQIPAMVSFYDQLKADGLITSADNITVSGHSLGGYLAQLLTVYDSAQISQAYTYNAPGFTGASALAASLMLQYMGAASGSNISAHVINIQGMGPNIIAGLGNVIGGEQAVFTEGTTHSIAALTDSLALYNLFATLDPALNVSPGGLGTLTAILKAASNVADRSLETTLDALGKLFGQTFTTATDNRESFYANLNQMQALFNPAFSVAYTVESLADRSAATLAAQAQSSLAARYALVAGNAFAVTGANYGAFNPNGELDIYDSATGLGNLTGQYLADRAAMLQALIKANTNDAAVILDANEPVAWAQQSGEEILYRNYSADASGNVTSSSLYQGQNTFHMPLLGGDYTAAPNIDIRQIQSGSRLADTLTGGNRADHLYGMAGGDTLQGGKGGDYLEGGQGADTYLWNTGDGPDTILDTDGQGSIVLDGQTLAGGESRDGGRTWQSGDGGHTYAVLSGDVNGAGGATLLVDGNLTVQHYRAGDLGLALAGAAPAAAPATARDIFGDLAPDGTPDDLGNPDGAAAPGRSDWLYDSAGNDLIQSGGGNDIVDAWHGGDDRIELGAGDDATMFNNGGDDIVIGGDGRDVLLGGDGQDRLYAREEATVAAALAAENLAPGNLREFLDGGAGDDTLIGGTGGDALIGVQGSDLILAGAGNFYVNSRLRATTRRARPPLTRPALPLAA